MKTKQKFTIEHIFDFISEEYPRLQKEYKKVQKTEMYKKEPLPFVFFCLLVFDKVHTK